jgi:hypothetical protein
MTHENNTPNTELIEIAENVNTLITSINYWNKKLKKSVEENDIKTSFRSFYELHFISNTILNLSKLEMNKLKQFQINNNRKSLNNK